MSTQAEPTTATLDQDLDGRVAVITGSAQGIGREIAEAYAARGATVVVSDLDVTETEATAAAIDGADAMACDVTDEVQVESLIAGTFERHGRLDVVVANAGIASLSPIVEMTFEQWRQLMAVNLDGVFLTVKHAGRVMAANGGGSIVTIGSITATAGTPLIAHYAASKAAVVNLTKTAAIELRPLAVRVNSILPGFALTEMVDTRRAQFEELLGLDDFDAVIAMKQGRYVDVGDIARIASFLASDRSRFCTGGAYIIDGGMTASLL